MKLISREKFEYIARRVLKYPLHDAEKDYFLALVMSLLSNNEITNALVFKGGTAIYHCFLNQYRFSEDLDFTSIDKDLTIQTLRDLFHATPFLDVKKEFVSNATIKIERLKYNGILDTPNSIKIEVDKLQNVYLPPIVRKYRNVWDMDFSVNVMDPVEICAEKLRACNERFRYRDFYDLYLMVKKVGVDIYESIEILPHKEVRKDITKGNILQNLKYTFNEIRTSPDNIYYKEMIDKSELLAFFEGIKINNIPHN